MLILCMKKFNELSPKKNINLKLF